jgi:pectinesterase inhibitor-like protein
MAMKSLTSVVILALFLLSVSQWLALVNADLIEDTCKRSKTPFMDLCVTSLRSDPRSSSADVKGLVHITFELVQSNVTDTFGQVKALLETTTDPDVKQSLNDCFGLYKKSVSTTLPDAISALDSSLELAGILINEVKSNAEDCERDFTDGPNSRKSPLGDRNLVAFRLGDIAFYFLSF